MKRWIIAGMYCIAGYWGALAQQASVVAAYRQQPTLPAVNLTGLDGKTFSSSAVQPKGKPMMVVYFSPMCGHCVQFTEELTAQLKFFKQVHFLFVSAFPLEDIKTFAITRGLHKMNNFKVGQDPEFKLGKFFQLKEIPAVFLYGKNGRFRQAYDAKVRVETLKTAAAGS